MSAVLWCSLQNDPDDYSPDDLGELFDQIEELDELCNQLDVKPLTAFVDESDMQFNFSEEDLGDEWLKENACWFTPLELLKSVEALLTHETLHGTSVAEELNWVRDRCIEAREKTTQVRLLVVI